MAVGRKLMTSQPRTDPALQDAVRIVGHFLVDLKLVLEHSVEAFHA